MYTDINFKTKKALRAAISAGKAVTVYNPFPMYPTPRSGRATVEGPHYPAPHTWWCRVTLQDGAVVEAEGAKLGDGKVK